MEEVGNSFKCPECTLVYTSKGNLSRHIKQKHTLINGDGEATTHDSNLKEKSECKFSCTECPSTQTTKGNLTWHFNERHALNDEDRITCPSCDESFTRYDSLSKHIDLKHKDEGGKCTE